MDSKFKCGGCCSRIKGKDLMKCCLCSSTYDLDCASLTAKRFDALSNDAKQTWKCPKCRSTEPKSCNTNTPIRSLTQQTSDLSCNVTHRSNKNKPEIAESDDTPNACLTMSQDTLRDIIRSEIAGAIKSTIKELVTEHLQNINDRLYSFEKSLDFYNSLYEDMKNNFNEKVSHIDKLQKTNEELQSTVSQLSTRLNIIEQQARECNVEINGIPEHRTENLVNVVVQLANTVDLPVKTEDIQLATRVAKMNRDIDRPRTVVVKLRNRATRDNLLAAVTKFNKTHSDKKLSTQHLGIGGKCSPVFVAEHLSPLNNHLHAAVRLKAKNLDYKFVWIRDGRIYVRKTETDQAIHIKSLESLALIK